MIETMAGRPWTTTEIRTLRQNANLGAVELASLLGRSTDSVIQAAKRHRVSLRRRGERRGTLLGQPRAVSLVSCHGEVVSIRELVLAGRIDMTLVIQRMEMQLRDEVELCPSCSKRPQEVVSTGLCRICHKSALTKALLDELAAMNAQREQWTAQQQVSRLRRRIAAEAP